MVRFYNGLATILFPFSYNIGTRSYFGHVMFDKYPAQKGGIQCFPEWR